VACIPPGLDVRALVSNLIEREISAARLVPTRGCSSVR
jgi:hypothetical protein